MPNKRTGKIVPYLGKKLGLYPKSCQADSDIERTSPWDESLDSVPFDDVDQGFTDDDCRMRRDHRPHNALRTSKQRDVQKDSGIEVGTDSESRSSGRASDLPRGSSIGDSIFPTNT
jgi:hypothetical protein